MGQRLAIKILTITRKDEAERPTITATKVDPNSIGVATINGKKYSLNTEKMETVNFEKEEEVAPERKTRTIYIRRK